MFALEWDILFDSHGSVAVLEGNFNILTLYIWPTKRENTERAMTVVAVDMFEKTKESGWPRRLPKMSKTWWTGWTGGLGPAALSSECRDDGKSYCQQA